MSTRRNFSETALLLPLLSCTVGFAATTDITEAARNPFRTVNILGDAKNVLFFFDFSCPFCAKFHMAFVQWMTTAPRSLSASFVPVINGGADKPKIMEQSICATCFYAAASVASKAQLGDFMTTVYEGYSRGMSLSSKAVWMEAVKFAKISPARFGNALKHGNKMQIQTCASLVRQYALTATPSVAIGGRYVLTPDDAGESDEMFFNLLNGLASRLI